MITVLPLGLFQSRLNLPDLIIHSQQSDHECKTIIQYGHNMCPEHDRLSNLKGLEIGIFFFARKRLEPRVLPWQHCLFLPLLAFYFLLLPRQISPRPSLPQLPNSRWRPYTNMYPHAPITRQQCRLSKQFKTVTYIRIITSDHFAIGDLKVKK